MFNCAQTFTIDPGKVKNSHHVYVSRVDLYFKDKPKRAGKNNKSGITAPGVTIYLVPRVDDRPDLVWYQDKPMARVEYDDINTSDDALAKTTFRFDDTPIIKSGSLYAIVIAFDGDEDFELWTSIKGDPLIDTGDPSPGSSTPYAGKYFEFFSTSRDSTNWRAFPNIDLKFSVYVCRFALNGNSISSLITNNTPEIVTPVGRIESANFFLPARRQEYATYNVSASTTTFFHGERVFQMRPFYPDNKNAATAAISNGSNVAIIGGGLDWDDVFSGGTDPVNIVFYSASHGGGSDRVDVRRVMSTSGNTANLDEAVTMTNSAVKFFIAPVATFVNHHRNARLFGEETDLALLVNSNANGTVRFVNNCVRSLTINVGGSGYSNSDHVRVTGFENVTGELDGGYRATANLVTNSTGGITTLYLSNAGAGFVNVDAINFAVWANSTDLSSGTGATFVANIGATLYSASLGKGKRSSGAVLEDVVFVNIDVDTMYPATVAAPHVNHIQKHRMPYYVETTANTLSGRRYYLDGASTRDEFRVAPYKFLPRPPFTKRRILPSWSNEWSILYANGAPGNAGATGTPGGEDPSYGLFSNAAVYLINNVVVDDFILPVVDSRGATSFEKYIINNDTTDEETNEGNAWARGIENQFRLATNAVAEDLFVYLTAYRPRDTQLHVYAKLLSPSDSEPMEDKDWTALEQIDEGKEVYSSDTNENDLVELSYKLPQFPSGNVLTGVAKTEEGNATVVGTNSSWNTDLANGDVIRIYPALFPNNYMVSVINVVTNSSQIVLENAVTNVGIVGDGLKVVKITRPGQAFSYVLNDNVARYYDTDKGEHDGFDRVQLKIVMTTEEEGLVPKVDDVRVIGVSA